MGSLREVREDFLEETGRTDLSVAAINKFINRAQQWLDYRVGHNKKKARHTVNLPAGSFHTIFRHCTAIDRVWVSNGDGRVLLEKRTLEELRECFPNQFDGIDTQLSPPVLNTGGETGCPAYWAPLVIAPSPDTNNGLDENALPFRYDFAGLVMGDHYAYRGVLLMPPMDKAYTVSIEGSFLQPPLVRDGDQSFWTEVHPDMLAWAAAYQMEVFYRNREGQKDWLAAIEDKMFHIYAEDADEQAAGINQMEG